MESGTFMGRPIQMKASSQQMFGVWRKHEKFPDLLLAYIWHVTDPPKTECYCLTFPQAISVAEQMKWTKTQSWTQDGAYLTNSPSKQLVLLLEEFKMSLSK